MVAIRGGLIRLANVRCNHDSVVGLENYAGDRDMLNKNLRRILFATASAAALSGCGANDIASPGTGGNIIINPAPTPSPSPSPSPSPTPTPTVTAAAGCPTISDPQGLVDGGVLTNPTVGSFRVCTLPARINRSVNLPYLPGVVYQMNGRVDVGCDGGPVAPSSSAPYTAGTGVCANLAADTGVTLSIEPGVILYGGTGTSWLAVNRGNKINAVGTVQRPIVFTSRDNILGLNTDTSSGQWGGVVLLGRAQVTDCAVGAATPGTTSCERQTEGAVDPATYGGADNTYNAGRMSYVQIRYSGYVLSANSELQSLTPSGVGTGTVLDHFQSFNSSDDGAEFFGGHVRMKYYVSVGAEDDNIDSDTGVKAMFQYVIVAQRAGSEGRGADSIIEADTNNAVDGNVPRQNTLVSNFVFLHRVDNSANDQAAILLRGGTDYTLANGVLVTTLAPCLRISRAQTASTTANPAIDELGAPVFKSVQFQCGNANKYVGTDGVTAAQVQAIFGTGANNDNDAYTNSLTSAFINGATETAVAAFDPSGLTVTGWNVAGGAPSAADAPFFDKVTYIGAVKDATDTWYQGWTCNSSTLALGTSNTGACTSLPVYS